MTSDRLPSSFFKNNRSKLGANISHRSLVFVCSNHQMPRNGDQYFPFRQHSDMYYLTGIVQERCVLLMVPDHPRPEIKEILFILKPTPKMETWEGHKLTPEEAASISGIKQVRYLDEMDGIIADIINSSETIYYNIPEKAKPDSEIKSMDQLLSEQINSKFPGHLRGTIAPIMTRLRIFKEPAESDAIKHACSITRNAFMRILPLVKPGMMEYEIEAEIIHEFKKSGADGHAYEPIIASGENALTLHYVENSSVCREGEMILMDFGAEYLNYASDCTRTVPVNGKFTKRQKDLYEANLRVLKQAIELMTVGKNLSDYHAEVGLLWQEEHIKLGLYTSKDVSDQDSDNPFWKRYFIHGTSHSLGLDVHDPLDRSLNFAPGMVLTCEPAIYIPEEKIGIRLENDILITENGPVDLMGDIPIEPDEIIKLMNPS